MQGFKSPFVKCTLSNVTHVYLHRIVTTYCQLTDEGGLGDTTDSIFDDADPFSYDPGEEELKRGS